jgi:hypothetical protein
VTFLTDILRPGKPATGFPAVLPVLVIEDEKFLLTYFQSALLRGGVKTVGATSGREALELLGRDEFAAIVSDLRLPGEVDGASLGVERGEDMLYTVFHSEHHENLVVHGQPLVTWTNRRRGRRVSLPWMISSSAYTPNTLASIDALVNSVVKRKSNLQKLAKHAETAKIGSPPSFDLLRFT